MEECPSLKTEIMEEYHLVVAMLTNQWAKNIQRTSEVSDTKHQFKINSADTNEARALLLVFVGNRSDTHIN